MAIAAGKHVYVEKPCSHNPHEAEMLVACTKKHKKVVQMGNQYRSVPHFREIVTEIHNGVIGKAFKATTFLSSSRASLPIAAKAPVPEGLDWDLFQGPAPRTDYIDQIWDYIWHWYGWTYGTAEIMNNGIHEMDIARWALQVEYPEKVDVEAEKRYFAEDGWTVYDTMEATFKFADKKVLQWDGKSRNAYNTYGNYRGVIIYGSEGTVNVDPLGYKLYNREGILLKEKKRESETDDGTITHISNFFNAIRGKEKLNSPIEIGAVSNMLANYANIAYRIGKPFEVDSETGRIFDRDAMKLWTRSYEPGWEPVI
jgi:predicted dehydrogenase